MTFYPLGPSVRWCVSFPGYGHSPVSLTQAAEGVSISPLVGFCRPAKENAAHNIDSVIMEREIGIVQSAAVRPRTECQNTFNLDSSGHPVRSRLNTCLASCDGWHRTPKILPGTPNQSVGTFFLPIEPRMYALGPGNKIKAGPPASNARLMPEADRRGRVINTPRGLLPSCALSFGFGEKGVGGYEDSGISELFILA